MIYVVKIAGSEQENSKGGAGVGDKGLFSRHLDFGALFVCLFESHSIFGQILVLLSRATKEVIMLSDNLRVLTHTKFLLHLFYYLINSIFFNCERFSEYEIQFFKIFWALY